MIDLAGLGLYNPHAFCGPGALVARGTLSFARVAGGVRASVIDLN
jgi:hypothetical protein